MEPITWTPQGDGLVEPAPTPDHPELVRLGANRIMFRRFDADPVPAVDQARPVLTATVRTTGYYALYIDTTTDRGRRQFKYIPTDDAPTLEYGYRIKSGLGAGVRDDGHHGISLDLAADAEQADPGVVIQSVDSVSVRVADSLWIALGAGGDEPPPPPPPEGEVTPAEAVRFLTQATFGASPAAIDEVVRLGDYGAWVDNQFALPQSRTLPYVKENSNGSGGYPRHYIWWANAMEEPDQLRQRLAFAWSEIFVVSDLDYVLSNSQYGISQFYDLLGEGASGNFRDLLETVTLHPVMGIYLSMLRNEQADPERNVRPDENFAREVLQLFSIGLYELGPDGEPRTDGSGNPLPSYDQTTVENFARVFTGWNYGNEPRWGTNNPPRDSMERPMEPFEEYHDSGEKTLLNGTVLPAGQTAREDLTAALDNIFEHPNVGPFIARSLILRLVTSNPTPAYIARVAAVFDNNGQGVRGDLAATTRAILTDAEARTGHQTMPETFGKIKEPILRLTQLWRAFNAQHGNQEGVYRAHAAATPAVRRIMGQAPIESPSVFNFFLPDTPLVPGGELVAPEVQILTEINVASMNNMLFSQSYSYTNFDPSDDPITRIQIDREVAMAADASALVEHLNLVLTAGALPAETRAALVAHLETHPTDDEGLLNRTKEAIACIVVSPFHLVQN